MPLSVTAQASDDNKHGDDVNTLLFVNNCLYSGADDGKVKVWDENLKLLREIQAHEYTVFSIAASAEKIYTCSNDGSIRAFDLKDSTPKGVVFQEELEILRLAYSNNMLYAGTDQGTVFIFKDDAYLRQVELLEPVKDLIVVDDMMYTVRDLELAITQIREQNKYVNKKMIQGRAPVCIVGDKICISSRSGRDISINKNSLELAYEEVTIAKDAHELIINALCGYKHGDKTLLYSAGWDKIVKEWEVTDTNCSPMSTCPVEMPINTLCMGPKGQLYAAGGNGKIVRLDG